MLWTFPSQLCLKGKSSQIFGLKFTSLKLIEVWSERRDNWLDEQIERTLSNLVISSKKEIARVGTINSVEHSNLASRKAEINNPSLSTFCMSVYELHVWIFPWNKMLTRFFPRILQHSLHGLWNAFCVISPYIIFQAHSTCWLMTQFVCFLRTCIGISLRLGFTSFSKGLSCEFQWPWAYWKRFPLFSSGFVPRISWRDFSSGLGLTQKAFPPIFSSGLRHTQSFSPYFLQGPRAYFSSGLGHIKTFSPSFWQWPPAASSTTPTSTSPTGIRPRPNSWPSPPPCTDSRRRCVLWPDLVVFDPFLYIGRRLEWRRK